MKICVTAESDTLDSRVTAQFGRSKYFLIIDTDTIEFNAIQNPNAGGVSGSGIQSANLVISQNVKTVITGNVGPNAFDTLKAGGIEVITGAAGNVREVVEKFTKGELKPRQAPNVGTKFGIYGMK